MAVPGRFAGESNDTAAGMAEFSGIGKSGVNKAEISSRQQANRFRTGWAASGAVLAAGRVAGCGNQYRPVINPVRPTGPSPAPTAYVVAITQPTGGAGRHRHGAGFLRRYGAGAGDDRRLSSRFHSGLGRRDRLHHRSRWQFERYPDLDQPADEKCCNQHADGDRGSDQYDHGQWRSVCRRSGERSARCAFRNPSGTEAGDPVSAGADQPCGTFRHRRAFMPSVKMWGRRSARTPAR